MLRTPPFLVSAVLLLAACDYWHLSINRDGLVFVSVIGVDDRPRDRFRLRTRHSNGLTRLLSVPESGRVSLNSPADGTLELTLLPPEGCSVSAPNPRVLSVDDDEPVEVSFDVRC
jgi:hypothetical protein